jgi:hypothetical protein
MTVNQFWTMPRVLLLGLTLSACASTGCQSTIGGQTLPSAYYLRDDVQFFPAGPEFRLSRQVEALEQYRLRQEGVEPAEGGIAP